MLNALELKLTALVGDAVAARAGLSVREAAVSTGAPAAGEGVVDVGLSALGGSAAFEQESVFVSEGASGPESRRLLPLGFTATLGFARRPAGGAAGDAADARTSLLEDISLVSHALAAGEVRSGKAFATAAPDPGFRVRSFELEGGTIAGAPADGLFDGVLRYGGSAVIWPPGVAAKEGPILAVDTITALLPLTIAADDAVVPAGGTTTIRVRTVAGSRLVDPETGARQPLALAFTVVSDLPPAKRGSITSGDPGAVAGFRIVRAASPETVVAYAAPTGDLAGTRSESIAVHLATLGGEAGAFLGSAPVLLGSG